MDTHPAPPESASQTLCFVRRTAMSGPACHATAMATAMATATTTGSMHGIGSVARPTLWPGWLPALRSPLGTAYRVYVEWCRRRRSSMLLPHSTKTRAAIVIGSLLDLAAETGSPIRLVSGELAVGVFGDLIPNVVRALDAKCDLRIVMERDHDAMLDNPFYATILARVPDAVRSLPTPLTDVIGERTHFLLVGRTAYRVEVEDKTRKATACFNDTTANVVPTLLAQFETAWSVAENPGARSR